MKLSKIGGPLHAIPSLFLITAWLSSGCLSAKQAGDGKGTNNEGGNPGAAGSGGEAGGSTGQAGSGGGKDAGSGGKMGDAGGKAADGSGGGSGGSAGSNGGGSGGSAGGSDSGAGDSATGADGGGGPSAEAFVLDDLEDCDATLAHVDGRPIAAWYQFVDALGSTVTPAMFMPGTPGAPSSPKCAIHLNGVTFTDKVNKKYGSAGVGFNFNEKMAFDASTWSGISFWAKGMGTMRFAVPITATVEMASGGTCVGTCTDPFGIDVPLTGTWTKVEVPWGMLAQKTPGTATFDPKTMHGAQFKFSAGMTFDMWIDNVEFIPGGAPAAGK